MFLKFLFIIIFSSLNNTLAFGSIKTNVLKVINQISILDIYGKRYTLTKYQKLKNGDYLKSENLPALLILNNKTKICLSSHSSLKIKNIKKNELNFELMKGIFYFSIPKTTIDVHNIYYLSYNIKNVNSDFIIKNKLNLNIINYNQTLNLKFKNNPLINLLPFSYNTLYEKGDLIVSSKLENIKIFEKYFLDGCVSKKENYKSINNFKDLQYRCVTQNGKLVCGNVSK